MFCPTRRTSRDQTFFAKDIAPPACPLCPRRGVLTWDTPTCWEAVEWDRSTSWEVVKWDTPTSWETMRWDTPTRLVRRRNRTRQQELWGGGMGHATRAMRWLHGAGAPQVGNDQGWHQIGRKAYGSGGGGYVYGGMGIRQICDMESDKIMVIWCCKYSSAVWQELWL